MLKYCIFRLLCLPLSRIICGEISPTSNAFLANYTPTIPQIGTRLNWVPNEPSNLVTHLTQVDHLHPSFTSFSSSLPLQSDNCRSFASMPSTSGRSFHNTRWIPKWLMDGRWQMADGFISKWETLQDCLVTGNLWIDDQPTPDCNWCRYIT